MFQKSETLEILRRRVIDRNTEVLYNDDDDDDDDGPLDTDNP